MLRLTGRDAVLEATGGGPYVRFATSMAAGIAGIATDGAVLWWGNGPLGRLGHGLGDASTLDLLIDRVRAAGELAGVRRINLPRRDAPPPGSAAPGLPPGFTRNEDWDFRWSEAAPPDQPGQSTVRQIDDAAAIEKLLDEAFPDSMLRPGHPMVSGWYGVWSDGRLVACAADRSTRTAEPGVPVVGVLGGIAVHPDHRRHGWGAAVTAALTTRLRTRHSLVALGVVADNHGATRLYERLGFTGVHEITSARPPAPA